MYSAVALTGIVTYRSLPVSLASMTSFSQTAARSPQAACMVPGSLRSLQSVSALKLAVRYRRVVNRLNARLTSASNNSPGRKAASASGASGRMSCTPVMPLPLGVVRGAPRMNEAETEQVGAGNGDVGRGGVRVRVVPDAERERVA